MAGAPAHPHLFFTADRLPALRAKTKHPRFRGDWEALLFQAVRDFEEPIPAIPEGSVQQYELALRAARCAFVYRISEEPRFGQRGLELLRAILKGKNWSYNQKDCSFGLRSASLSHNLALAYDLLYEQLAQEERRQFTSACHRELIEVFLNDCRNGANEHLGGQRTMNHVALHASGAGCLLLALHGDDGVDYAREIEITRAHILRFVEWYDDAGASLEIGGYWVYGMGNALRFLVALRENGWPKIFKQRAGKLMRTAYPLLCMSIGQKYVTNFSDTVHGIPLGGQGVETHGRKYQIHPGTDPRLVEYPARTCALILAAEFKDGRLQQYAGQTNQGDELALICGDPDLPEATAAELDALPTCIAYPGCGVGILRGSHTDPNTLLLGIKAGRARGHVYDDPHCQFDLNSVVLEGFGQTLLADPGYMHVWGGTMNTFDPQHVSNSTPPHNTLLVGGAGQTHEDSPIAHLQDLSPSAEIDYLVSRIERAYGPRVKRFDRHAYFVAKRFFLLVDEIELAESANLTWNFHGVPEAAIEAGAPAWIRHAGVELCLRSFGPAPLACRVATDHVLPRLQFDTTTPVTHFRTGWLLQVQRQGGKTPQVSIEFSEVGVQVGEGSQHWELPVVPRRCGFRSDLMLPIARNPSAAQVTDVG